MAKRGRPKAKYPTVFVGIKISSVAFGLIQEQVEQGAYKNASEYIRSAIENDLSKKIGKPIKVLGALFPR